MRCRRFHWSLLLLTLTWPVGAQPALAEGVLRVGVAEVDITPPKGFLVAGYYHERLATGTIDPLKARAMVIRTEQVQAALVTCDLTGVAGPLRETAAFTAIECDKIADWVAEHDPEVIGLSDVVDDTIRRRATLNLLAKFRRQELTDTQIILGGDIELKGFQYAGAEVDLRPVLRERSNSCEDVLECAIALVDNWQLTSMSNDLADLVLDDIAPLDARRSAGYALRRMGTFEARRRLRPLINDHRRDPDFDLKGSALSCNWPDGLTVTELLAAIEPRHSNRHGTYEGFLFDLDRSGFDAGTNRLEGLMWALQFMYPHSDILSAGRIARRIAIASVDELDKPGIAEALVDVILAAAKNHADSPLTPIRRFTSENEENQQQTPVLEGDACFRGMTHETNSGQTVAWRKASAYP